MSDILLNVPVPITTPRLSLRFLQENDGKALHEAKLESWDQLSSVFAWAAKAPTLEQDERYVRQCEAKAKLREDFNFVGIDKKTNQPIVWAGIHCHDWRTKEFQIGYWVRKSAQGQGYAKEAANALIRYAFDVFKPNRLIACHREGNLFTKKIITGMGFEFESVRKKSLVIAGEQVVDALWYVRFDAENLPAMDVSWPQPVS